MARNTLRLDTSGFTGMLQNLDSLGGDVKKAVEDSLVQAAQTIRDDTLDAMRPEFLPAQGKYSIGTTKDSIIQDFAVRWDGLIGWVPVGFDFSKAGAGGYLITGTPRMKPDTELRRMYKQKRYMLKIQEGIFDVISDYVIEAMEKK